MSTSDPAFASALLRISIDDENSTVCSAAPLVLCSALVCGILETHCAFTDWCALREEVTVGIHLPFFIQAGSGGNRPLTCQALASLLQWVDHFYGLGADNALCTNETAFQQVLKKIRSGNAEGTSSSSSSDSQCSSDASASVGSVIDAADAEAATPDEEEGLREPEQTTEHANKRELPTLTDDFCRALASDWEREYLQDTLLCRGEPFETSNLLGVLQLASLLRIEGLQNLCAAFLAFVVEAFHSTDETEPTSASDVDDCADSSAVHASVRQLLQIPNEWSLT